MNSFLTIPETRLGGGQGKQCQERSSFKIDPCAGMAGTLLHHERPQHDCQLHGSRAEVRVGVFTKIPAWSEGGTMVQVSTHYDQSGDRAESEGGSARKALKIKRASAAFYEAVEEAEAAWNLLKISRENNRLFVRYIRTLHRCERLRQTLCELTGNGFTPANI